MNDVGFFHKEKRNYNWSNITFLISTIEVEGLESSHVDFLIIAN